MAKPARTRYSTDLPNGPVVVTFPGRRALELSVEDGTVLLDDADLADLARAGHRFGDDPSTPPTGSGTTPDPSGTTE
jgi:hypothetical protein